MSDAARSRVFLCEVLACWQFVVLTAAAMFVYPGGTRNDPTPDRYLFWQNFFSDLGRTRDFEGGANYTSCTLFVIALLVAGITSLSFFCAVPQVLAADTTGRFLSAIMTILGACASLGFVGTAVTPWDHFQALHDWCVHFGFRSLLLACVVAMICIYRTAHFPNVYGHVMAVVCLVLVGYILLLTVGPSPDTDRGLSIQSGGQKIVVYALIIGISVFAIGARRVQTAIRNGESAQAAAGDAT